MKRWPTLSIALHQLEVRDVLSLNTINSATESHEPPLDLRPANIIISFAKDLPDLPDDADMDWRHKEFPELAPDVLLPSIWQHHYNPVGADGMTRLEREGHEANARMDARIDAQLDRIAREGFERPARLDALLLQRGDPLRTPPPPAPPSTDAKRIKAAIAATKTARAAPTTLDARIAAKALAAKSSTPRFAAPTAATKARTRAAVVTAHQQQQQQQSSPKQLQKQSPPASRASRATVGYAKGRRISSGLRDIAGDGGRGHEDDDDDDDDVQRLDTASSTGREGRRTSRLRDMFVPPPSDDADADGAHGGRVHQRLFGPNDDDVLFDEAALTDFVLTLPVRASEGGAVARML